MYFIYGFYKFKNILDLKKNREILQSYFINKKIRGTIIISREGINGTISAKKKNLDQTYARLQLINAIKIVIKNGLTILGINCPNQM